MPLYVSFEQVRLRLVGKVRFGDEGCEDDNKMSPELARRLINEAEGQVEQDLSPRYAAPFQTDAGDPYAKVPDRPTKQIITTLCELVAVSRILETDFGSGSATDGEKYRKAVDKRYEAIRDRLLAKRKDGASDSQGWMYPPLPGLRLNYFNTAADTGYMGTVIVASGGDSESQSYPKNQINDPAFNFWNGVCGDD